MQTAYRDILKHSAVYGVGQILTRLASFLLLPVYTAYLTPADYGCIAILDLTAGILGIVIGAEMAAAMNRYHFECKCERDRDRVWWTGLTFLALLCVAVVAPGIVCRGGLARITLGAGQPQGGFFYLLVLPTLALTTLGQPLDQYLRVRKWSGLSVAISLGGLLLNIGLNVSFLVIFRLGIAGILWGNLIANAAMTAVRGAVFVHSRGPFVLDKALATKLWRFGGPLMLMSLLTLIMHQADRYVLRAFLPMDRVGIYSLAYTMGQAVNTLFLLPFGAIWGVVIFEVAHRPDVKQLYVKVFRYSTDALIAMMLGVSLAARPIVSLMAAPDFAAAADVIPIVCFAYLFFSLTEHFNVPARVAKNTACLVPSSFLAAGVNLGANLILIPSLGMLGAAWASVATFGVLAVAQLLISRRIDVIPYPLLRTAAVLLTAIGLYVGHRTLQSAGLPAIWTYTVGVAAWLGFVGALLPWSVLRNGQAAEVICSPLPESGCAEQAVSLHEAT